jgi:hypothetical protein
MLDRLAAGYELELFDGLNEHQSPAATEETLLNITRIL